MVPNHIETPGPETDDQLIQIRLLGVGQHLRWDLVTFQITESQEETVIHDLGFLMGCRGKLTTDPKRLSCCRIHMYKL